MRLVVFSHKPCWFSAEAASGFATDGGFPFQMRAISELFDQTTLVVPCDRTASHAGEIPLQGHNLRIAPLTPPKGRGLRRKIGLAFWLARNLPVICREVWRADAVHSPIPGDIGTIGMVLALLLRKPLFVRHCGNWLKPVTRAEHFWKWSMEKFAGGKNVMLATGGAPEPPSRQNAQVLWIFSTSLREEELQTSSVARRRDATNSARLIIVCRQDWQKGTGTVIDSLPLITKSFPEVSLDVVGDGDSLEKFRGQAQSLRVEDRVRFHGKVNHEAVIDLLRQADLFCYPTCASEGFPKVVLEALATGLPVITTPVSVLPELMSNGGGELLAEATPEALAERVVSILTDGQRYREMSARAIETAAQYSLEKWRDTIGDQLRSAWGELVTPGAPTNRPVSLKGLRVTFVVGTLGRGGAERQLIFMLNALKESGVRLRVLCLTNAEAMEGEIRELGIPITWVGKSRWRPLRLLRIIRELRREPADIVQSSHFYTNLYAGVAGRLLGIKSIGAIRNDLISELHSSGLMGRGQLQTPHHLIANSRCGRDRAIERGVAAERIDMLPNAVHVNGTLRYTLNVRDEGIRILFAGRLVEMKRPDRFLRVLKNVSSHRPDLQFKALIAGDGPLRSNLEREALQLGLKSKDLEFLGELRDVRPICYKSDFLMLTSDNEGTPNVILEAMACGLPVIATRVGGVPDIVANDRGFIVEPDDEDALTRAAITMIEDGNLRSSMGQQGHDYVARCHSINNLSGTLLKIYQRVFSR